MRVWIQWATATPSDYVMYDLGQGANAVRDLPTRAEPPGGQGTVALDETLGWVAALNVQGIVFSGYEHYGMAYNRQARILTIGAWNDEPADNSWGPYMTSWTLEFPRNDPQLNAINTVQARAIYVEPASEYATWLTAQGIPWLDWATRPAFPTQAIRHCPWLSDEQYAAHAAVRNEHVWDEWIEGQ